MTAASQYAAGHAAEPWRLGRPAPRTLAKATRRIDNTIRSKAVNLGGSDRKASRSAAFPAPLAQALSLT
jgi:hypothetical protein